MPRWRSSLLVPLLLLAGCGPEAQTASERPLRSPGISKPPQGTLQVAFIDVGQGDSALVQAPGGVSLLIDGGPSEAGPKVLETLRSAGVDRISWLIGTHPHEDHIGGLLDVLKKKKAERALDPGYVHGTSTQKKYLTLLKEGGTKVTKARAGQVYDLGSGATLEILAPGDEPLKEADDNPNNHSVVARLVFGNSTFLFTGDMEEAEREVMLRSTPPEKLRAQVLKVAHHGSHNGTDPAFLKAVQPEYAVISCARVNDYGHPHREALQALADAHVKALKTFEQGTIVFTTDGKTLKLAGGLVPPAASGGGTDSRPAEGARQGQVIGNRTSHVYHSPDCPSLPDKENQEVFAGAAAAKKAGYRPHRACMGK